MWLVIHAGINPCLCTSTLGHVTSLGWPRAVYYKRATLNAVSWNSESKLPNGKMVVTVNGPNFQYQMRESQNAYLVQIWWFQPKSITSYFADKSRILSQNGQSEGISNDPRFQYQAGLSPVPRMPCFMLIGWFQSKSSYLADKPNLL